jgi:CRISPR system Cascade subunit CasC
VAVRDDQPVNLVSAFEKPVYGKDGLAGKSTVRLAQEMTKASSDWGVTPLLVASRYDTEGQDEQLLAPLGPSQPFPRVVEAVGEAVAKRYRNQEESR